MDVNELDHALQLLIQQKTLSCGRCGARMFRPVVQGRDGFLCDGCQHDDWLAQKGSPAEYKQYIPGFDMARGSD